MQNFHEHTLWQQSYVILMDIHEVVEGVEDTEGDIIEELLKAAQHVSSKIADGLSRMDRRYGKNLIADAVGLVAVARTQLAVAWGRGILDDGAFKKLDDSFQTLSEGLQRFK